MKPSLLCIFLILTTQFVYSQEQDSNMLIKCKELYESGQLDSAYYCYTQSKTIHAFYGAALISKVQGYDKDYKKWTKKLVSRKYRSPDSYYLLAELNKYDTLGYLKAIKKGLKKFKKDSVLLIRKVNFFIKQNDYFQLINCIDDLIEVKKLNKDNYYYIKGFAYQMTEQFPEAVLAYNEATKINISYFDAYYNIGTIYYNKAASEYDSALNIPYNKQDEYVEIINSAKINLKNALPYFEKANKLRANDKNTLEALKTIYYRLKPEDDFKLIKDKINTNKK